MSKNNPLGNNTINNRMDKMTKNIVTQLIEKLLRPKIFSCR